MSFFSRIKNLLTPKQKTTIKTNLPLTNIHGVSFTKQEQNEFAQLAKNANKMRKQMLKREGNLTAILGGERSNLKVKDTYGKMGRESDFVLREKSLNINKFRTRDEFLRYMDYLRYVNSKDYIPNKMERYRDNFVKSLVNVYGNNSDAKKLIKKIESLPVRKFADYVAQGDIFEISYLDSGDTPAYSDSFADTTLRQMMDLLEVE